MPASTLRAKRNVLESLGKIYHLSVALRMFLLQRRKRKIFFFYSLHDIVNNNSSFNDSIANYFWSWFVISFLLNSRENGNSVWKQ